MEIIWSQPRWPSLELTQCKTLTHVSLHSTIQYMHYSVCVEMCRTSCLTLVQVCVARLLFVV